MKKRLTALFLATSLVMPTGVFAAEGQATTPVEETVTTTTTEAPVVNEVDPGLTPEDNLYILDQLLENVEVVFTFDPQAKAELYANISLERLAELNDISEENRSEFVTKLLTSYQEALVKATENIEEAKADGEDVVETSSKVDQASEQGTITIEELQALLEQLQEQEKTTETATTTTTETATETITDETADAQTVEANTEETNVVETTEEETQQDDEEDVTNQVENSELEELLDQMDEVIINAKVTTTTVNELDNDEFVALRDQGVGYGKISLTISISNLSGKSVEEVSKMLLNKGVGKVAKELGLHPGNLKKRGLIVVQTTINDEEDATKEDTAAETNIESVIDENNTDQVSETTQVEMADQQVVQYIYEDHDDDEYEKEEKDDDYDKDEKYNEKYAEEMFKLKEKQLEQSKKIAEKKLEIAKKVAEKQNKFAKKDKEKKEKGNKERD